MKTSVKKLYEAMFLVDSALVGADWDAILATIRKILERSEAEIVSLSKWDERRLAYNIKGVTRGTYILCYFRADGGKIQDIERDIRLNEQIMRVLILTAEHLSQQDIEKVTATNIKTSTTVALKVQEKQAEQIPTKPESAQQPVEVKTDDKDVSADKDKDVEQQQNTLKQQ
ncbi:MAG: 30S ribosomal protein S6 [Sedimentisphaerales bacterium]|nr:30S ribosomal protein S6 [Sedimentisphaerales bacterium]